MVYTAPVEVKTQEQMSWEKLSPREKEISEALHRGMSRKDIASSLGISSGTLQNYVAAAFHKLDVKSEAQLVLIVERAKVAK